MVLLGLNWSTYVSLVTIICQILSTMICKSRLFQIKNKSRTKSQISSLATIQFSQRYVMFIICLDIITTFCNPWQGAYLQVARSLFPTETTVLIWSQQLIFSWRILFPWTAPLNEAGGRCRQQTAQGRAEVSKMESGHTNRQQRVCDMKCFLHTSQGNMQ